MTPSQILQFFEVLTDGGRVSDAGLWLLGCVDKSRVTVVSQQHRALTLIAAMFESGRAKPNQRVGVIGGGAGGMTCAYAAAMKGAEVSLFERESQLVSTFDNASHRWLHPSLFNWPQPGWEETATKLPFLNWSFSPADQVAAGLRTEFEEFCQSQNGRIRVDTETDIARLISGDPPRIQSRSGTVRPFDHLIIAVGFGREYQISGSPRYWDAHDPSRLQDTVVLGTGDGGLIDAIRTRVPGFSEDMLVSDFFTSWDHEERKRTEQAVMNFEGDLRQERDPVQIAEFYGALNAPAADRWFAEHLSEHSTVEVIGRSHSPLTSRSAPLNRFLFSRLQQVDSRTRYSVGHFDAPEANGPWQIRLDDGRRLDDSNANGRVLIRVGPRSELRMFSEDVFQTAVRNLQPLSSVDLHREYLFPQAYQPSDEEQSANAADDSEQPGAGTGEAAGGNTPETRGVYGRQEDVAEIAEKLESDSIVVVYGLSGIGKSKTISELRYTEEHRNRNFVEFSAFDDTRFEDLFRQMAVALGDRRENPTPPRKILGCRRDYTAFLQTASAASPSLVHIKQAHNLFRDGAFRQEETAEFFELLAEKVDSVRIVLESREDLHRASPAIRKGIQIRGLSQRAMEQYFRKPFPNHQFDGWTLEREESQQIFERLGGDGRGGKAHPLAMHLLAFVSAGGGQRQQQHPAKVLQKFSNMLLKELEEKLFQDLYDDVLAPEERRLLRILALYRDGIPDRHINHITSVTANDHMFQRLVDRCLLNASATQEWYFLHSLISDLTHGRIKTEAGDLAENHAIIAEAWLDQVRGSSRPSLPNIRAGSEAAYHVIKAGRFDLLAELESRVLRGDTIAHLEAISHDLHQRRKNRDNLYVLELLVSLAEDDPKTHRFLGETIELVKGKGHPEALPHYERAHKLLPDRPHYLADLGRFMMRTGRPDDFVSIVAGLEGGTDSPAVNQHVLSILADCLQKAGSGPSASELRMQQINSGSNDPAFYTGEARYQANVRNDPQQALKILSLAEKKGAWNEFTVGAFLEILKSHLSKEEASAQRMKLINKASRFPEIYRHEASCLKQIGDFDGAMQILDLADQRGIADEACLNLVSELQQKAAGPVPSMVRPYKDRSAKIEKLNEKVVKHLNQGRPDIALQVLDDMGRQRLFNETTFQLRAQAFNATKEQ